MGTSGRRENEDYGEYQRRVIAAHERRNALPKMTLEMPLNETAFSQAVIKNIYPDSTFVEGQLSIIKKTAAAIHDFIFVEVGGVRCRFRFNGEGYMDFESEVMKLTVEFVGFVE